jgi:hypothetical protein
LATEYDPVPPRPVLETEPSDLEQAQSLFSAAAGGYLRSPWSWWAWSLILPAASLATRPVAAAAGPLAVLLLWSVAILAGGLVEGVLIVGARRAASRSQLSGWVLSGQGNLSLVAIALSALLVWRGLAQYVPAVWLLVVGHSFFAVGGLSFRPLRSAGLGLQAAGIAALLPGLDSLVVFALGTFGACAWIGAAVRRAGRGRPAS